MGDIAWAPIVFTSRFITEKNHFLSAKLRQLEERVDGSILFDVVRIVTAYISVGFGPAIRFGPGKGRRG